MTSPTQRTLKHLREQGCELVQVVERWNAFARVRQDLFGIVDVVAIKDGETIGVQATSLSNVAARIDKITASDALGPLRKAGWRLLVHGWGKGPNGRYRLREVDVS